MQKSLLTLFCALSALSFIPSSVMANSVTVPNDPATTLKQTSYLPVALKAADDNYGGTFSVSQQLYFASELSEASSTTIEGITFYCYDAHSSESSDYVRRKLRVWMNNTSITAFPTSTTEPNFEDPGTKVFSSKKGDTDNGVEVTDTAPYTITFDTPFEWDGTSNIIVTVFDSTGVRASFTTKHDMIQTTGVARFLHQRTLESNYANASWSISNLTSANAVSITDRGYVNKITFNFAAAAVPPSTPSNLAASSVGVTSASLSWSAVDGATSYKLYHSTSAEGIYTEFASPTTNSYDWSGLTANTTYYVKAAAVNGAGSSDLSEPISFTTLAPHIHDGITFEPWSNPSAMPTSGNHYLATDVAYDFYAGGFLDLAGNLNLCLNGHTINLGTKSINVTNGKTMTLYDPVGGGKITGFVPGHAGTVDYMGVISVEYGGTLVLREGEVENTYPADDPEYKSIAIAVGGTLILSGAPGISSNEIDIYLPPTIPAKVITIEPGKPLTTTTPYRVYKESGVLTSGWANMSGADPKDYFVSANPGKSICLREGEAALQTLLTLSETAQNSAINSNDGQIVDVNLTRPLVASQYNTFCLPFALTDAQLQEYFGAEYDLEEFVSSSLEDEVLNLTFNKVTSLEAGKPYLLKPADDVSSVMFFDDVTIEKDLSNTVTSYVDFKGVYSPTELEGGNRNILFLGAGNELFWPASDGEIKAFRAYFEVKNLGGNAPKARIVKKEDAATGVDQITNDKLPMTNKILRNGEILILRDGKTYNVLGIECK